MFDYKYLSAGNLKSALRLLAEEFVSMFPEIYIRFAKSYGKRKAFITGAGQKNYIKAEEIKLEKDYYLYIEKSSKINEKQLDKFIKTCNFLINKFVEENNK